MFETRWLGTWLAVAVLSAAARGGVIVVNGSGGFYTSIASAVAAAQDGDTILVKAGNYGGFSLSGKSLSIVAETGAVVSVQDVVTISNLSATQTVVFGGLRIRPLAVNNPSLHLESNHGAFRAQGCTFEGRNGSGGGPGAFFGANAGGTAFVDCVFRGGNAGAHTGPDGWPGRNALWLASPSQAALYDCTLVGGAGSTGYTWDSCGRGGAGAELHGAGTFLHASGSSFQGGPGGNTCDTFPVLGGDGGPGVYLENALGAWYVESSAWGGPAGVSPGCWPPQPNGYPGQGFDGSCCHTSFPVGKLEMKAPWLVREGNQVTLTIRGEPGVKVFLESSPETQFVGAASWRGVDVVKEVKFSEPALFLGKMPSSGVMTYVLPIPLLPLRVDAETRFLQVRRLGSNGLVIGSFAALTVLDSAY